MGQAIKTIKLQVTGEAFFSFTLFLLFLLFFLNNIQNPCPVLLVSSMSLCLVFLNKDKFYLRHCYHLVRLAQSFIYLFIEHSFIYSCIYYLLLISYLLSHVLMHLLAYLFHIVSLFYLFIIFLLNYVFIYFLVNLFFFYLQSRLP